IYMSRFINIDMNMGNARMTYIMKQREYLCAFNCLGQRSQLIHHYESQSLSYIPSDSNSVVRSSFSIGSSRTDCSRVWDYSNSVVLPESPIKVKSLLCPLNSLDGCNTPYLP
ncbi:Os08g0356001, partial [Oryza sativa Japonica Group]